MQYILPPFFYSKAFAAPFFYFWAFPFLVWTTVWKGIALWQSAKNSQKNWFITLLLINTIGILEIIYLCCFQKIKKPVSGRKPQSK